MTYIEILEQLVAVPEAEEGHHPKKLYGAMAHPTAELFGELLDRIRKLETVVVAQRRELDGLSTQEVTTKGDLERLRSDLEHTTGRVDDIEAAPAPSSGVEVTPLLTGVEKIVRAAKK